MGEELQGPGVWRAGELTVVLPSLSLVLILSPSHPRGEPQ